MKNKIFRIIIISVVAVLLILIFLLLNSIYGNPISKMSVNHSARVYIDKKYPDLNLTLEKAKYDFKCNSYYVLCSSKTSIDTHFTLYANSFGKITYDSYDSVKSGQNTNRRLSESFNDYVKKIITDKLNYNYEILFCDTMINEDVDFPLDTKFSEKEILSLPDDKIRISISDYITVDKQDMTWDNVISKLRELNDLLKSKNIVADSISLLLKDKTESTKESFGVHDVTQEVLNSANLKEKLIEKNIYDGIMPKMRFQYDCNEDKYGKCSEELIPSLIKWDGIEYKPKTFDTLLNEIGTRFYTDSKKYTDKNTLYFKLGTTIDIQMEYGDVPDKCVIKDFVIDENGNDKYESKTIQSKDVKFSNGVFKYTIEPHYATELNKNDEKTNDKTTFRGFVLECTYGDNKTQYLYVYRTDLGKDNK